VIWSIKAAAVPVSAVQSLVVHRIMSFQNPSLSLSNGAEVISGFIRSVSQSVARKVSRRHSMGHYDRLNDPVIPRSFNTMTNLPATPEKVEVNEKPIRTPSVTSVRPVT
jgi:hypothetical protein